MGGFADAEAGEARPQTDLVQDKAWMRARAGAAGLGTARHRAVGGGNGGPLPRSGPRGASSRERNLSVLTKDSLAFQDDKSTDTQGLRQSHPYAAGHPARVCRANNVPRTLPSRLKETGKRSLAFEGEGTGGLSSTSALWDGHHPEGLPASAGWDQRGRLGQKGTFPAGTPTGKCPPTVTVP